MKDEAQITGETELYELSLPISLILTIGGLLVLLGSSKALVWGATEIALFLGSRTDHRAHNRCYRNVTT